MARWKAHCRHSIISILFSQALMAAALLSIIFKNVLVEIGVFWRGGSRWAQI